MKVITNEQWLDESMGPIGSPARDRFEIKILFWTMGRHAKYRRKEFGFSHEDLANRAGLDVKDVIRIERGNRTIPTSKIHQVWRQLGIAFNGQDFGYYPPHWSLKPKPTVKKKLTKPSTTFRTIVR